MTAGVILLVISQICRVSCSTYFIFPTFPFLFCSSFLKKCDLFSHAFAILSWQRHLQHLQNKIFRIYAWVRSIIPYGRLRTSLSPFLAPFQMNSYVGCMQIACLRTSCRGPADRAKQLTSDLATTGGREQEAWVLIHAGIWQALRKAGSPYQSDLGAQAPLSVNLQLSLTACWINTQAGQEGSRLTHISPSAPSTKETLPRLPACVCKTSYRPPSWKAALILGTQENYGKLRLCPLNIMMVEC